MSLTPKTTDAELCVALRFPDDAALPTAGPIDAEEEVLCLKGEEEENPSSVCCFVLEDWSPK